MSEQPTAEKDSRRKAAETEIRKRFAGLMYELSRLRIAGIEPSEVLIPARLNVPYDGPGATDHEATFGGVVHVADGRLVVGRTGTDHEATCMGLPVRWAPDERWGLVVALPEPRVTSPGENP